MRSTYTLILIGFGWLSFAVCAAQDAPAPPPVRRTPYVALKVDLARPVLVNAFGLLYYAGAPDDQARLPVFVTAEAGLGRYLSVDVAGHFRGGVRQERVDGVAAQLRCYCIPDEVSDTNVLRAYFALLGNYRRWQDQYFNPAQEAKVGGIGGGGGGVLVFGHHRVRPTFELYMGSFYQKRLRTNTAFKQYYQFIAPEDDMGMGGYFSTRIRPDVRLTVGLQL